MGAAWERHAMCESAFIQRLPGVKLPGREVDHSPSPDAEVKN
jgi:hypothetical protein